MDQEILNSYSRLNDLNVSRETFLDFENYISMILEKNKKINIISQNTASKKVIIDRHIVDSAQIIDFIDLNSNTTTDMGSGGGMPGRPAPEPRSVQIFIPFLSINSIVCALSSICLDFIVFSELELIKFISLFFFIIDKPYLLSSSNVSRETF